MSEFKRHRTDSRSHFCLSLQCFLHPLPNCIPKWPNNHYRNYRVTGSAALRVMYSYLYVLAARGLRFRLKTLWLLFWAINWGFGHWYIIIMFVSSQTGVAWLYIFVAGVCLQGFTPLATAHFKSSKVSWINQRDNFLYQDHFVWLCAKWFMTRTALYLPRSVSPAFR